MVSKGRVETGGETRRINKRPYPSTSWQTDTAYMPQTLVSLSHASNAALQIAVETNDAVHRANYGPLIVLA